MRCWRAFLAHLGGRVTRDPTQEGKEGRLGRNTPHYSERRYPPSHSLPRGS